MVRRLVLCCLTVSILAAGGPAAASICSVDTVPASSMLLPYFEVDLGNPNGSTTLFTVNNAGAAAVLVHVTIWSDLAVPVLTFNFYLTGYDVQQVNLRDLIVNGFMPATASTGQDPNDTISPKGVFSQDINFASCNGVLPPPPLNTGFVNHLQTSLTGRPSPLYSGHCSGQNVGDNVARGYITFDTVNNCTLRFPIDAGYFGPGGTGDATNQNVLWGDWIIVNSGQNLAMGGDLVRIEADGVNPATSTTGRYTFYGRYDNWTSADNREPLGTEFAARYEDGGAFAGGSFLFVWRDPKVDQFPFACTATAGNPPWYPLSQEGLVVFDEQEHASALSGTPFPAASQRRRVNGPLMPVPFNFGWLFLDLNASVAAAGANPPFDPAAAQAHVISVLTSSGHYAITTPATNLDSACTPSHAVPH